MSPVRRSNPIDAYARAVRAGTVLAGKYHRLACERHLRDRARESTAAFPYRFEMARAERFFRFAEKLKHYKGEWAGSFIHLEPYQRFRLGSLFAWVHRETGLRRFRTHYNEIPRKQGKSLEAAIVAVYVTFFDGEPGAEGYTIATKREQAKIVFNDAKRLVQASGLRHRIQVLNTNLSHAGHAQKLEPLGADKDSTDGLNPNLIIVDEFHAQKTRGLIDVMETATGSRRQPVNFQITTAGDDPMTPCGDQHDYACKILDGVLEDETFFAFLAHADPEDIEGEGWLAERTWRKANPNYGVSIKPADLQALATKARFMPSAANAFKQKRLNVWINTAAPWLSLEGWRKGQTSEPWTIPEKTPVWIGVDLSSKIDLAAVAMVAAPIDRHWRVQHWGFTPEETLDDRALRDRAPYRRWVEQGWLVAHPGNRVDQGRIKEFLVELGTRYDVQHIGIDPWNAGNLESELTEAGFVVLEVPQTMQQMSAPAKEFEADVLDGLIDAHSNPLLTWMISNVVVQRDNKDNIYPVKKRSRGRIDGVIALLLARKLAMAQPVIAPPKKYQIFVVGGVA